jgi:urea transport system permease protein
MASTISGFALMVLLVPGLLAFLFGWFAFRSRVTGVYLSIITQAMTYALLLAFFRNDFGFGGNNGLTDFKDILGFNIQAPATRASAVRGKRHRAGARHADRSAMIVTSSKLGKVMVAVRDAESRTRFLGYRPENVKLFAFVRIGHDGGCRRRALRAAGRHHQSRRVRTRQLHRSGDLGRRSAGAARFSGRSSVPILVNGGKSYFTGALPEYWLFALGGLFIFATIFLPKGVAGLFAKFKTKKAKKPAAVAAAEPAAAE